MKNKGMQNEIAPLKTASSIRTISTKQLNSDFKCAICLEIIQSATAISHCLHRFCHECISNSFRYGKKECPSCRVKCSSHRDLKPDPRFDRFIRAFYPDLQTEIEKQDDETERIIASISPTAAPSPLKNEPHCEKSTEETDLSEFLDVAQSLSSSTTSLDFD